MDVLIRPHGRRYNKRETKTAIKQRYTYKDLEKSQAMTLDEKITWSHERIANALANCQMPSLAFSGGKDSTVLLHMVRQHKSDICTIYGNTTIEFPECIKFSRTLRDIWALNYYEAKPEVTFWWIVENYGWPLLGKTFGVGGVAHKSSRQQFFDDLAARGELVGQYAIQSQVPISSACCTFLKERPSQNLQIHQFNIPYARLYDMGYHNERGEWIHHKRNGCMFCGMDIQFPNNHLAIMRRTHPKARSIWRDSPVSLIKSNDIQ